MENILYIILAPFIALIIAGILSIAQSLHIDYKRDQEKRKLDPMKDFKENRKKILRK